MDGWKRSGLVVILALGDGHGIFLGHGLVAFHDDDGMMMSGVNDDVGYWILYTVGRGEEELVRGMRDGHWIGAWEVEEDAG